MNQETISLDYYLRSVPLSRYPLLLSGILKNTPKNSPDYATLQQTLKKLQQIAEEVNEYSKKKDSEDKLFELAQRVVDFSEDVCVPGRVFVFEREIPVKLPNSHKEILWVRPLDRYPF